MACSPLRIDHHEDAPFRGPAQTPKARLPGRVLEVWTVQGVSVEEDGDGFVERDAVLVRVGFRLSADPTRTPI